MKACVYVRVSTNEQTVENQLQSLRTWAESRGYQIMEAYQETESAWKAGHQKELARLLDDLELGRRKYDACLVWSLDRLTREGIGTLIALYSRFGRYGCKLVSMKESFTEFPNEFTPIFLAMIAFFAKWESDRRSERTLAGLDRVVKEGQRLGRPKGSKDKKKRRRVGYLLRYANKRPGYVEANALSVKRG